MSLKPEMIPQVSGEPVRVVKVAFPNGSPLMRLRKKQLRRVVEEEGKPLSSGLEEELLEREMGYFWMMSVKMRGIMTAVAVLVPDALFLIFGILGFFNIAGIHIGVWHRLTYLAIALVGFALSILIGRVTYVAVITLLRAVYVLVTGLACLVIGTGGLIYPSYYSNYPFLSLISVSVLNGVMWLILGFLTFLAPILLAYAALSCYLTIMAYGQFR
ncbi:MAG: hypothetical protein NVSMB27_12070 [Ktedonobacteraceae bacterium]